MFIIILDSFPFLSSHMYFVNLDELSLRFHSSFSLTQSDKAPCFCGSSCAWVEMCPPAQPTPCEIGFYWSDEQIILLLADYSPGSRIPDNVLDDSNPFQSHPRNLPDGMWFLVHSNEKKGMTDGFWKAKGEPCKVYSNNGINGWRTTLEYFEGLAPDGQLTNWFMQEYKISPNELGDKCSPKASRLLCRVFLCGDDISRSKMISQNCKNIIESKNLNPVKSIKPDANVTSDQDMEHEPRANRENDVGTLAMASDVKPSSPPGDFSEGECFSRGDFLELDDLQDPESHSSSSQNSSCPSKLSEEYFGSDHFGSSDFLRDLEEEVEKSCREEQFSRSCHRFSAQIVQNNVVLQPALPGSSVVYDSVRGDVAETPSTSPGADETSNDKKVHSKAEGAASTSNGATREEKKSGGSSRINKFKTYFCFAAF
ncbi:NAC domain-containing protein 41-like isoform X1 [Salvia splendens]|uniref:NAC domain-containing protein 41-like isoform X1 n=1 Tax=Salvia splendens TaxID=180675 RepID=UPI001C27B261|nr:NAC domain-containing protein 41-like isoform X1 [Salvia splendens]